MPKTPQSPDPRRDAARQGGTWTEEEKTRGAGTPGQDAGGAGSASTAARPNDDRARTEGAAAAHAPDPATPVGGGRGHRSTGGSATKPEPEDPARDPMAPRNPA